MKNINFANIVIAFAMLFSSACVFSENENNTLIDVVTIFMSDKAYQVQPNELNALIADFSVMATESKDDTEWVMVSAKVYNAAIHSIKSRYQAEYNNDKISSWSLLNHGLLIKDSKTCFSGLNNDLVNRLGKPEIEERRNGKLHLEWLVKKYYGVILSTKDDMCELKFVVYQGDEY